MFCFPERKPWVEPGSGDGDLNLSKLTTLGFLNPTFGKEATSKLSFLREEVILLDMYAQYAHGQSIYTYVATDSFYIACHVYHQAIPYIAISYVYIMLSHLWRFCMHGSQ